MLNKSVFQHFTEEAIAYWQPEKMGARGRLRVYSDIAIETAVFIRQVFHLPLRQTEGFMTSLARIMKAEITLVVRRQLSWPVDDNYLGRFWLL